VSFFAPLKYGNTHLDYATTIENWLVCSTANGEMSLGQFHCIHLSIGFNRPGSKVPDGGYRVVG
jgi:hypothetical protein